MNPRKLACISKSYQCMSIFSISISHFFQIFSNILIISKEIFIDLFKEQVFIFMLLNLLALFCILLLAQENSPLLHVEKSLFTHVYCCFFEIYLFSYYYYFDGGRSAIAARGLALVVTSGGCSFLLYVGFSLQWLLLLPSTGSRRSGFRSRSARAHRLQGTGSAVGVHRLPCSMTGEIFLNQGWKQRILFFFFFPLFFFFYWSGFCHTLK